MDFAHITLSDWLPASFVQIRTNALSKSLMAPLQNRISPEGFIEDKIEEFARGDAGRPQVPEAVLKALGSKMGGATK